MRLCSGFVIFTGFILDRKDANVSKSMDRFRRHVCIGLLLTLSLAAPAWTAEVHDAAMSGDLEKVKALLEAEPGLLDAEGEMGTPLIYAVLRRQIAMAEYLIARGADVNAVQKRTGFTPLHGSVYAQSVALAGLVLDRGADINARSRQGISALDLAVIMNKPDVAALLIERGAALDEIDGQGRLPLSRAAELGRTEIAQRLIEAGADVEAKDSLGQTALLAATAKGRLDVLDLLLDHGADVSVRDERTGRNALHLACLTGYLDVVEKILAGGVDVAEKDGAGKTALFYAAKYGHRQVAGLLQNRGAEPAADQIGNFGPSPYLSRKTAPGEFAAWYLNNRGWVVKTKDKLLVFDAEEFGVRRPADPALANGFLAAEELRGQDLLALYTCYHGDPGELAAVHELAGKMKKAVYVHLSEDRFRDGVSRHYFGPGEEHEVEGASVRTIEAATGNPAHAYLVRTGSLSVFYMGFQPQDADAFVREIARLADERPTPLDVAFLPIPEAADAGEAFFAVLDKLRPRTVCLLDPSRRENLYPAVADRMRERGFAGEVFCAEQPGDHFVLEGR